MWSTRPPEELTRGDKKKKKTLFMRGKAIESSKGRKATGSLNGASCIRSRAEGRCLAAPISEETKRIHDVAGVSRQQGRPAWWLSWRGETAALRGPAQR